MTLKQLTRKKENMVHKHSTNESHQLSTNESQIHNFQYYKISVQYVLLVPKRRIS